MSAKRVRVGKTYIYNPVFLDQVDPPYNAPNPGDRVKVINLHGAPKANTMGMCYIDNADGKFAGMVCTNSLEDV